MDHTIKRNLSCRAMVNFSKNQVARVPRLLRKRNSCLDRMKASREALPCPALSGPVQPCPALSSDGPRSPGPLLGQASVCSGQARSWDRPLKMLGTGPLLGQALQNAWDMPVLGTGPSKSLGQALPNAWDRPAIGTGQSKCLGQARSWDRPFKMLGTGPSK